MGTEPQPADGIALPDDFAAHLASVSNLETPPETLEEYWAAFEEALAASDETIGPEDLCTDEPTRHEVRLDGEVRYSPCVLDALGAAAMVDQSPVTVRSVDPVTRTPVTFTVDDGDVDVTPAAAVITFGVAPSVPELDGIDEPLFGWMLEADDSSVARTFCQYINAFESPDTYEEWAATTDGHTFPVGSDDVGSLVLRFTGPN